jgi:serine/threonine protein kinase
MKTKFALLKVGNDTYAMLIYFIGEIAAVKILESIHEIIEEIEEEYKILRDFNDHPNMPKFYGLYLRVGDTGTDDQLWMVMEVRKIY